MTYLAIIYNQDAEKRQPGLPFGMRGDRLFHYVIDRPKIKGEREKVEVDGVVLKKGTNFVDAIAWEAVKKHPSNELDLQRLTKLNAIVVYIPDDPETAAKDTTDFADESIVQELVENISDVEWLKLSINVDRRIPVRKLISDRLKDIDEETSAMRQRISASSLA
ncbi:hypothetical protein LC605_24470 [Nostoc sp. CHAB 5836]|uniref:hypothetical protein n=1 Tax=Nostoc sp. CHAB 5836 TaxID=2780404 RepID=UPI001E3B1332|nr:hypothetical protein [Nostoc sp. CHAB 5836]MCC5618181.1 hypothetical protein [Nostoc sp. CHAB 5836]